MPTSIKDLLSSRAPSEPPEFQIIRDFVQEKFQERVDLKLQNKTIVISAKGSALAGELQLLIPDIQSLLPKETSIRVQVS